MKNSEGLRKPRCQNPTAYKPIHAQVVESGHLALYPDPFEGFHQGPTKNLYVKLWKVHGTLKGRV